MIPGALSICVNSSTPILLRSMRDRERLEAPFGESLRKFVFVERSRKPPGLLVEKADDTEEETGPSGSFLTAVLIAPGAAEVPTFGLNLRTTCGLSLHKFHGLAGYSIRLSIRRSTGEPPSYSN